jgi:predicted GTPase
MPRNLVILGAAGRDFHNFNVAHRDDENVRVVAFTAQQIPGISGRLYPPELAGPRYPDGIPIIAEEELETVCRHRNVDTVELAYSDLSHADAMHLASRALACGCDFEFLGPKRSMLKSKLPVIAVSAVRTGCGKSQTSRWIAQRLTKRGRRVAVLRHPMPYGDLARQAVQRFGNRDDLERAECTNEEREEYEAYIDTNVVVFAGVDYAAILAVAEKEADLIIWDGGNNDFPFLQPDCHIVLVDALRPDQVASHHPGEAVLRMADVIVISKTDAASGADAQAALEHAVAVNPTARIVRGASPIVLDDDKAVTGRRVLVVDDGPTLTHGGMAYGAGYVAASRAHPSEIVDARKSAVREISDVYRNYPHLGRVLPAVGYSPDELLALRDTIAASRAEVVVSGTPLDLAARIDIPQRIVRAHYAFAEVDKPGLGAIVDEFLPKYLSTS